MSKDKLSLEEVAEVFRTFYEDPTNTVCMDCNAEAKEWISVNNAISLCGGCAAIHSNFNEHVSQVRAIHSPDWEWKDLMLLRNGGNMKFKLFLDEFKINPLTAAEHKYKTKAAFYYRRKLRHLCEGKPEPKAPTGDDIFEEVEHDNFLDKVADFFTGIFGGDKKDDNLEAHPGPLREETQAQGLLAPRIENSDGLKLDSFRPELGAQHPLQERSLGAPGPAQAQAPAPAQVQPEPAPAKEFHFENAQLPLANDMQGNYEKKDWMPSQKSEQKPLETTHIKPASLDKELKKGEKELHQVEEKEIVEAKSTFEKIRDKTDHLIHEGLEKLKEGIHEGANLFKSDDKSKVAPTEESQAPIQKKELPKEKSIEKIPEIKAAAPEIAKQEAPAPIKEQAPIEAKAPEAPIEEKAPEAPIENKEAEEPELDIYRVLRHSKTKEIIEHEQIMTWKHQRDEKELQSLAGEAAESIKARVMPSTTRSKAEQIAQQAAMLEAARGLTKLSKGADCDHEVVLHGQVDFEYMEKLESLAKDPKQIEKETTIEEVRKSEDFGVPEIFRANIARLSSKVAEPSGNAAPQKIVSLKKKEKRDARLAKKKQRADIQAHQPIHTKLTEHPIDISLPPLEGKIAEKQLEGFSIRPLDNSLLPSSLETTGKASPHTPKHSMSEGVDMLGKPIIKASTAHLEPLTHKAPRRKHYFKLAHKKEATEEGAEKVMDEIPKKLKQRHVERKLSLAEKFKQKVMGSFEMAKDTVTENLGLVRENSGSIMEVAKEKFEAVKEKAAEKLEQVKDSHIMEATKEKYEHAKEKVMDTVEWLKDKFAPAAADGVKVAEPTEPAPQTEESAPLKPVGLTEEGEFAANKQAPVTNETKELLKERIQF